MTFSIIIPAFNADRTLGQCLESVSRLRPMPTEIIVVDDGSVDNTRTIALKHGARIISHESNKGLPAARQSGLKAATGDVVIYADSDVLCPENTIEIIGKYFSEHNDVDALTGLLSEAHPHANIWTCYKNITMHYNFTSLPERVTFLYGAVFSLRRLRAVDFDVNIPFHGEDTAYGQKMHQSGRIIGFCPALKVSHLHTHSLMSAVKDSFFTSKRISELFWKNKGWRCSQGNRGSFASAPRSLLLSIACVWLLVLLGCVPALRNGYPWLSGVLLCVWIFLNLPFFRYCYLKERFLVALLCPIITFVDQICRGFGIMAGSIYFWLSNERKSPHA